MKEEFKKLIESEDYDFLRKNPHLGNNIILLGLGGSHAYGTNIKGSDVDIRGVALNTKREILLGHGFEQVIDNNTDTVVYGFNKLVKLLTGANPNVLEIIFNRPDEMVYVSPIGQELIDHKDIFLSQRVFYTFGGYARAQLRRLDNKSARALSQGQQEVHILNSIKNASITFPEKYFYFDEDSINLYVDDAIQDSMESEIFMDINLKHYPLRDYKCMWSEMHNIVKDYAKLGKRATNAITHNKVNKHAMHLVRLMKKCVQILQTGTFSTYCDSEHDLLMDIRNGLYMGEDGQMTDRFFKMVDDLEEEMNEAMANTKLPEKPRIAEIEDFVCSINEKVVKGEI